MLLPLTEPETTHRQQRVLESFIAVRIMGKQRRRPGQWNSGESVLFRTDPLALVLPCYSYGRWAHNGRFTDL